MKIHSTGHISRLGRFAERPALVGFGSVEYSKEELIAEMGASFLNALAGIKDANFKNSLAYLKGWFKPLQEDPKMLIWHIKQPITSLELTMRGRSNPPFFTHFFL
jgi:antirestriction protein ArdC